MTLTMLSVQRGLVVQLQKQRHKCSKYSYLHTLIHTYIHKYIHTYINTYIHTYSLYYTCVPKPMSQASPGYCPPLIKQKRSYQHGSKSEQVPRYPLLCRNPRNAVINKKHVTMSNA